MNKLYKFLQQITPAPDKLSHFFWGFILTIIGVILSEIFNFTFFILIPSMVLGAVKEFVDSKGFGRFELFDFFYTIIPSVIIFIIHYFI